MENLSLKYEKSEKDGTSCLVLLRNRDDGTSEIIEYFYDEVADFFAELFESEQALKRKVAELEEENIQLRDGNE